MYWIRILGAPALVGAIMFTGCSDEGTGTVTLSLTVTSFAPGETASPIPDAEVCVEDTEQCATTDADGLAEVTLPTNSETALTVTAAGFNSTIVAETTGPDFVAQQTTFMLTDAIAGALAALLGIDYPLDGTGVIGLTTALPQPDGGGVPGVTFALTSGTGTSFYNNEGGIPTYDLEATSSFGAGGFVEVGPGTVEIEVGGSASGCSATSAWPGTSATSIRVPVRDGFITFGSMACEAMAVTVTVVASDEPFGETAPLPGAEVCQDGTDNCVTTDEEGQGVLEIPGNVEFAYEVSAGPDYFPLLSPQVSDSDMPVAASHTLFPIGTVEAFALLLDTPWPPTLGVIGMIVYEKPFPPNVGIPGVSFQMVEGTGESYYLNDANIPTTTLTETLDNGTGGFFEVTEGTVEMGLTGTTDCEPSIAWPGAAPNQFRMPSRGGYLTVPIVRCGDE